jgi:hypothetical protein
MCKKIIKTIEICAEHIDIDGEVIRRKECDVSKFKNNDN